jgi:hypothetical protein
MQSLKNKIDQLESFLTEKTFEALCLTETWIHKSQADFLHIPGYKLASAFNRQEHNGGGVSILLKDGIEYRERKDIVTLSLEYIIECSSIEIPELNVILICVYRPNREIETFYNRLEKVLDRIRTKAQNRHIIIGGDFNIDMLHKNKLSRRLSDNMLALNLVQIVKEPTRIAAQSQTCIDLLFTNNKLFELEVSEFGLSDHKGIVYNFEIQPKIRLVKNRNWTTIRRVHNQSNHLAFKEAVKGVNWNNVLVHDDANNNYKAFQNMLKNILNKTIPLKRIKIKTTFNKTWLTKGLRTSCKNKRFLRIHISNNNKIEGNCVLKTYYKYYNRTLKKCINFSKKSYYIMKMKKSTNKIKTMWQVINEANGKPSNKLITKNIKVKSQQQNVLLDSPEDVANALNDYFANVFEEASNNTILDTTTTQKHCPKTYDVIDRSMFLHPVSEREIYNIIKKSKSKRSSGIDEIPSILLKTCVTELTPPITKLINQSFVQGLFPDDLKISLIKPVFKKGDDTDPCNYRPIALLPSVSKIYEKAMCDRLYGFLEKNKVLHTNQYGFRKDRSTTLAVTNYMQTVLTILNKKKHAVGLLLDLTKAYDRVCHKILLNKIYYSGVRGIVHDWFKSYLQNRTQHVQITYHNPTTNEIVQKCSERRDLKGSIPQGSVLGCVLFLMYINDLPKTVDICNILFADDISLLFEMSKGENQNEIIKSTLCKINNWLNIHNLQINLKKTKLIQFYHTQNNPLKLDIVANNIEVEEVAHFNLLGITLDNNINWRKHIEITKTKISSFLYALYNLRKTTDLKTTLSAYHAFAHSRLSYGIMLWGNSTNTHELFVMQKRCVRIMVHIQCPESCKPYFKSLGILPLPCQYILTLAIYAWKNKHLFKQPQSARNKHQLLLPPAKIKMLSNSPQYTAVKIYNKLPNSFKALDKYDIYHKKLKSFLLHKCYYCLDEFWADNLRDMKQF